MHRSKRFDFVAPIGDPARVSANPLIRDRDLRYQLFEVHRVHEQWQLARFAHCDRELVELYLKSAARFARERALPWARGIDENEPALVQGRVRLDPRVGELFHGLVELGVITAEREFAVGGHQLPQSVTAAAHLLLMAGNGNAISYAVLTSAAAHLIEMFGDEHQRRTFMAPLYAGRWTGTMALSEAGAGSSLGDLTTRARVRGAGAADGGGGYLISGSKLFITGGDQDFADNVVHLVLARIDDADPGPGGVSLFIVPRLRPGAHALVDNDVAVTQLLHKLGVRGIPSVGLAFGEGGDCHGWLLGAPGKGLVYMFQMMNEARLAVGTSGVALASAGFHESLGYARLRVQGRHVGARGGPQVAIVEHADVRRMLLRQKSIVEGATSLCLAAADLHDIARHHPDEPTRREAAGIEDFLTPMVKTLPAEWGFESNNLALQILGGYGYCRDFLPELWMRDQRLNSIHEGTTGIQMLDLLGRKVLDKRHSSFEAWARRVSVEVQDWHEIPELAGHATIYVTRLSRLGSLVHRLRSRAESGALDDVLSTAHDFFMVCAVMALGWQWGKMIAVSARALQTSGAGEDQNFHRGKLVAGQYWLALECARVDVALDRLEATERGDLGLDPAWL